jgi:peptidoglycan hydrolase CwlO-like protein
MSELKSILEILVNMQTSMNRLQEDIGGIKADITNMKADIAGIKTDMKKLNDRLTLFENNMAEELQLIHSRFDRLEQEQKEHVKTIKLRKPNS